MLSEELYNLILISLAGEAGEEEKLHLREWRKEAAENEEAYREICRLWYSTKWKDKMEGISADKAWRQFMTRRRNQRRMRTIYRITSVAASMILILGSVLFYQWKSRTAEQTIVAHQLLSTPIEGKATLVLSSGEKVALTGKVEKTMEEKGGVSIKTDSAFVEYTATENLKEEVFNELIVPKCGEYVLKLADGSRVFLNSESTLRFPVHFTGKKREVFLTGEAYFEVVKDAAKPFIVHTDRTAVQVLGTEFNIMAYGDEENTEVTLVEGAVEVAVSKSHERLVPGQQMSVNNTSLQTNVRQVKIDQYIAWKKGLFCFDAMPLEQLLRGLSRWYDISYTFRNADVKKIRFTGGFKKTEGIEEIFRMIENVTEVKFRISGNNIIIE